MKKTAAISPQNLAEVFISDVEGRKLPSCAYIKQAVKRHKSDLKTGDKRGFYFDKAAGEQAIELFSLFRHTSGQWAKQPFKLQPWQAFLIYCLFGWKKKGSELRRFTKAYIEVAKKNGKSELAAGIALVGAFFDGEYGAEVYSAANKLDQASICWRAGVQMAKFMKLDYPDDGLDFEVHESFNNRKIFNREDGSFFAPVAADSKTLDGLRPHFAIIDEYHEAPDDGVLRNLESGTVSRTQPLLFIITTAGFNRFGPCYQVRKVVGDILLGTKTDDSFFGMIFTLDEGDDWQDEKTWIKSNPSIGVTPTWDAMRSQYVKARNEGASAEINFKTKNLNVWTNVNETWIQDDLWMAGQSPINMEALRNRVCYAGLDLAMISDLSALVLFFPSPDEENEPHITIPFFWIPEDDIIERSRRDGVPYLDWQREGLVYTTPGNATDFTYIEQKIYEICNTYRVQVINYDPFMHAELIPRLIEGGAPMEKFGQKAVYMNPAVTAINRFIKKKALNHAGNPVLRWMCGNVQLFKDSSGNVKFDRKASTEKIDGMVSLAMAVGGWINTEKPAGGASKYETESIVVI